jgi:hypothetical protein
MMVTQADLDHFSDGPDWDDMEALELRAERDFLRRQNQRYMAHPDCRDPDHPGCESCMGDEDD